jgi:hypothetical protein
MVLAGIGMAWRGVYKGNIIKLNPTTNPTTKTYIGEDKGSEKLMIHTLIQQDVRWYFVQDSVYRWSKFISGFNSAYTGPASKKLSTSRPI